MVTIIDSPCGRGKTTYAINYIVVVYPINVFVNPIIVKTTTVIPIFL